MTGIELSGLVQNFAVAAAAVLGGAWALYRFLLERQAETALRLDIASRQSSRGGLRIVQVDVTLTNKGRCKLAAKRSRNSTGFAFDDEEEFLKHSCGLQIKRIDTAPTDIGVHLNWFTSDRLWSVAGIDEIDLLGEYEQTSPRQTDFWIEPGEISRLGTTMILPPGDYLIKVTFIGARARKDFWSRIQHLRVT